MTDSNGDKYIGHWENNEIKGYVEIYYAIGAIYKGEWKDGKANGKGTLTYKIIDICYIGEWKDGKREGEGEITWPNGKKYKGHFKYDKYDGYGELYYTDGRIYKGEWINGYENGESQEYNPEDKKWYKTSWNYGKRKKY